MFLVAHSFGGFLASSYTLAHPERVEHLILVDPWGFPEKPANTDKMVREKEEGGQGQITSDPWLHFIARFLTQFNPLTPLRVLGPYGQLRVFFKALRESKNDSQDDFRSEGGEEAAPGPAGSIPVRAQR